MYVVTSEIKSAFGLNLKALSKLVFTCTVMVWYIHTSLKYELEVKKNMTCVSLVNPTRIIHDNNV